MSEQATGGPVPRAALALRRVGDAVRSGEPLYRIHAEFPADFAFAGFAAQASSGYTIGTADEVPHLLVEF